MDSIANRLINKVDEIVMSTIPNNYSTYANKLYNRKSNINMNEIKSKMYRSIRWKNRISDLIGFTIDSYSASIDW